MFQINDDLSIYATRGDTVFFAVTAEDDGKSYQFQPGDVLRIKVFGKKDAEAVVLQRDFPVLEVTEKVEIFLSEEDTKIGDVISKPTDYWYEVELNPETAPQTIIGYDEDGAKVFKLFPEGDDIPPYAPPVKPEDIPVVDEHLDVTSARPVENRAVAREIVRLQAAVKDNESANKKLADRVSVSDADIKREVSVERARIDNLVASPTADDAELVDIRVGADGVTYGSAGTAVREQIASVLHQVNTMQDSMFQKSALDLPVKYYGAIKTTIKSGGQIISGTENVVSLMDLAQGTFTHSGITIQVSGNTVIANGTATANVYFSLHTGEGDSTGTILSNGEAKLPERPYTLSQKVTAGTVFPPFSIRGKSGGNIVTTQNNTAQFEYAVETCGHPYLYFTSGRSYDCKLVLGLFPYEANIYDEHIEQTSAVSVFKSSGVYTANGYTWASGAATAEKAEAVTKELSKKCLCRYERRTVDYTGADEVLDIYIPTKVGYTYALMGHSVYEPNNADVWRIIQFSAVDDGLGERYKITQFGETEMAVKIAGRDDFIGGYTHGDEITIPGSVVFILDGTKVDPTTLTEMTEFDELRISEATEMFDPADHTTQVGTHGKEYVITADGIYLDQSVKWMGAYTLDASYMPMLCAIRGNDKVSELQITDTYIDNGDFTPYDVGTAGFTTYPLTKKTGVDRVTLFSDKSGVCATVKVLESPDLPGAISFLYNGTDTYNKIYFAVCGYGKTYTTTNGEKWRVRANLQIEIGNGIDA